MAGDPHTDPQVKKKLMQVLGSWYIQFKDDPKMQLVAGLYKSCGGGKTVSRRALERTQAYLPLWCSKAGVIVDSRGRD